MQIYFIRHTKPDVTPGTCYGQTDLPLAYTFQGELKKIQKILPDIKGYHIFSSPLQRCLKLAQSLSKNPDTIITDSRIMELNFGDWEMKPWVEIKDQSILWSKDFVNSNPPNGETFLTLFKRAVEFLSELLQSNINNAVVVSHSGIMHALLTHFLKMPLNKAYTLKINYGQILNVVVMENNHFQVEFLNS